MVDDQNWYNEHLRGKYAYWINCRYIVPFDEMSKEQAVSFEVDVEPMLGYNYYALVYIYEYKEISEIPEGIQDIPEYPYVPTSDSIDTSEEYILVQNVYYKLEKILVYKKLNQNNLSRNIKMSFVLIDVVPQNPSEDDDKFIKTHTPEYNYIDQWDDNNDWILNVIDVIGTEKVNSIAELKSYNECIPESVTLDQIKKFRTWLAESLLEFETDLTENQTHVLSYYANGMTDDTIKWLTEFGAIETSYNDVVKEVSCGCVGGGSNVSSLYNTSVSICDPISIYKNNLHNSMVQLFSDMSFWEGVNKNLLRGIVIYLEGIVRSGLSLVSLQTTLDNTFSCKCLADDGTAQKLAVSILEDLIESFNYIINDDVVGHKLTIQRALSQWSDKLYEVMEWD